MFGLELKIFDRLTDSQRGGPADSGDGSEAAEYFIRSYLGMRFTIGMVAFFLPWLLILVDWIFITSHQQIRDSMSAYYHSSARDIFVGGLIATGGFLVSYMNAKPRTYDFWLSTMAGLLVITVALVPTGRALDVKGFQVSSDSCQAFPGPPACNGVQTRWGENVAQLVHGTCASLFVLLLAAMCVVFALREFGYGPGAEQLCGRDRNVRAVLDAIRARDLTLVTYVMRGAPDNGAGELGPARRLLATPPRRRVLLYLGMAIVIVASGIWALLWVSLMVPFTGLRLGSVYVGEVCAFAGFGIAWIAAGQDLQGAQTTVRAISQVPSTVRRQLGRLAPRH